MAERKNIDPVCGMEVEPKEAAGRSTFQNVTYYFCSVRCKEQFDADPVKHLLKR